MYRVGSVQKPLEFPLTDGDISQITEGNGMGFWGDGITITKIYIKVPTN